MLYTHPQLAMALAVFSGSIGSGGAGLLLVFTAQNLHPRVHVSPRTMIVAVAIPSSPPFQHCPSEYKGQNYLSRIEAYKYRNICLFTGKP